jgi:hypothetical protein
MSTTGWWYASAVIRAFLFETDDARSRRPSGERNPRAASVDPLVALRHE